MACTHAPHTASIPRSANMPKITSADGAAQPGAQGDFCTPCSRALPGLCSSVTLELLQITSADGAAQPGAQVDFSAGPRLPGSSVTLTVTLKKWFVGDDVNDDVMKMGKKTQRHGCP